MTTTTSTKSEDTIFKTSDAKTDTSEIRKERLMVIGLSVTIGLILNWVALYLNIALGFLSIGISSFFVLLIAKLFLGERATNRNLALVNISYVGASSAEASVGLLLLIWLAENSQTAFSLPWTPESWLLPSSSILTSTTLISIEWVVPILVHYFLAFIPGIAGMLFGLYVKDRYINNEEEYPFPGVVQRNKMVDVLITNQTDKIRIFRNFLVFGFLFAGITLFVPAFDLSQPQNGWIFGISLGVVGVALLAAGFIINNPKITFTAAISSTIIFVALSPFMVKDQFNAALMQGTVQNTYFDFFNFSLQHVFLNYALGFLISAVIITPIVWNLGKKVISKLKDSPVADKKQSAEEISTPSERIGLEETESTDTSFKYNIMGLFSKLKLSKRDLKFILGFSLVYLASIAFLVITGIVGSNLIVIVLLSFWLVIVATFISGLIVVESVAKTSTAMSIPFVFDTIPLYIAGARGLTPYLATPKAEIMESISMVSNSKFAQKQGLSTKEMVVAYLFGYIPAILTTPVFGLLLWQTFGIGTAQLPAPAFPVISAFFAPFAAGDVTMVLNIGHIVIGALLAILVGPSLAVGAAFGFFFFPHMAVALALGGLIRIVLDKKYDKKRVDDKGSTAATAMSVGASFTIPLLILVTLFFG